jgi:error-prone DNA polymerase
VCVDLARLDPADSAVYDMLCAADTVGAFQVALIRPGPIQGGSVHPYLRRRRGESRQHDQPLLARALDRTLGVPLFREQVTVA